jgi:asparagine synthase (glutamine-hydrolysing)
MMWRVNERVVGRRLDDGYVLVNLETQEMFELNSSGARIWELLLEKKPLADLERSLADEFAADPHALRHDVRALIDDLVRSGMLHEAPSITEDTRVEPASEWMIAWTRDDPAPIVRPGGAPHRTLTVRHSPSGWTALTGASSDDGIAIEWDARTHTLRVSRDRIGNVPCFYVWDGRSFFVSSSVDPLLAQSEVSREIHRLHLSEYVYGIVGAHQTPETFFAAIKRLPGGHRLSLRDRALEIERYWDPLPEGFAWATEEEADRLEAVLARAVERSLDQGADSIALSGGFDSVTVALLAAPRRKGLTALSIAMTGTENDESSVQRRVAEMLGMPQRWCRLPGPNDREDFADKALELSGTTPCPVLSMWQWMLTSVIDSAKGNGCSKILMGTGGDEMFNVDPRYARDLIDARDLAGLYRFIAAWTRTSPLPPTQVALQTLWVYALRPMLSDKIKPRMGSAWSILARARARLRTDRLGPPASLAEELRGRRSPRDTNYVEALRSLLTSPVLAMELDQCGAWTAQRGVTLLCPFYDRELVELALRIRPEHLYRSGRMKDPLRNFVATRMPEAALPKRKVDFTHLGDTILRASVPRTLRAFGGLTRLHDLGVIDLDRTKGWMGEFLAGKRSAPAQVWRLLSAEAWLRARELE